jgi:nitroimidazol reductase NimA-like FMN-containing flavoprotein (pyridoxamine 5'-phosphate oxidase superfamily)
VEVEAVTDPIAALSVAAALADPVPPGGWRLVVARSDADEIAREHRERVAVWEVVSRRTWWRPTKRAEA